MGGADTWRGIAFQAALTTSRAMDVLEGHLGDWLDIDAGADVIDYASGNADGRILLGQAKTRQEPYDWPPADLAGVIGKLVAEADDAPVRMEFVTDGQLSPVSANKLLPALARVREGQATADDWEYLGGHGLGTAMSASLARVDVITRYDSPSAVLDRAVRRLRALADLAVPISDDEAELRVARLLRAIEQRGAEASDAMSRLTREEISAIVEIDVQVVDNATPWNDDVADEYRDRIGALPSLDRVVELEAELQALTPTVSSTDFAPFNDGADESAREPVLDLLDRDCLLVGPAGAGKSRSTDMLRRRAAEVGLVPVLLAPRTYSAGGLQGAVGAAVGRVLGRVVAPATGQTLLSREDTVLIIDGASEMADPQMRVALARDLRDLRAQLHAPTVIVSGRSVGGLRPIELPAYRLRELDRELRTEIAGSLVGDDAPYAVGLLDRALGEAVGNPLLFTMGLELLLAEEEVEDVASVYAGFVNRLARNADVAGELQSSLAVVGMASVEMVEEEQFSLDRWSWLSKLERAADALKARGLVDKSMTAVGVIDAMTTIGLFIADEDLSGYSLWHDSFRDWLAAEAIGAGAAEMPAAFDRRWTAVASHLAGADRDDEAFLAACAADLIVCATAAERSSAAPDDPGPLATRLFQDLVERHLPQLVAELAGCTVLAGRTDGGLAAYLLAPGEDAVERALGGVQFGKPAGALQIATTLILGVLREAFRPGRVVRRRPAREAHALARSVEEHFVARRDAVDRLVSDIAPTLADAVRDHLRWRGLRATLTPSSGRSVLDGHRLTYSYDADGVRVTVSCDAPDDFRASTLAEDFVRDPPERAAIEAVNTVLKALLPGYGRG